MVHHWENAWNVSKYLEGFAPKLAPKTQPILEAIFQPVSDGAPMECWEENSIAPRREVDSQPIRQLDRPAVSQTETHTLGFLSFLSIADTAISSRERMACHDWHRPNSNAGGCRQFVRRFEPRCWQYGISGDDRVCSPGFEPPTYKSAAKCFTIRPAVVCEPPVSPLLGAFSAKTFDPPPPPTPPPPPPPPSKKCCPVLGDRGLRIKKSIGGWSYWAK